MSGKDLSIADLQELMVIALENAGWTQPEIAGYIAAMRRAGWLRPNCPAWIRNSAGVYFAIPPNGGFGDPRPPVVTRRKAPN